MRNNKIFGAIHASMFCAFFISFIFRSDTWLMQRMGREAFSFFAAYLNAELIMFAACSAFFLWFAIVWKLQMHLRLFLILILSLGCIAAWFFEFSFIAIILMTAALCAAMPYAVNYERFEPVRLFWAFMAMFPVICFPNIGYLAGVLCLIIIFAQKEIPGIRWGGRIVLAFMMLTAFFIGLFPVSKKNIVPDVKAEHFRQNYELMMLAYAQHGGIPEKTVCYFNHPWRNMNDLAAIVTKLSVDRNENMSAYFAGDQFRFSAEHDLRMRGKHIPVPVLKNHSAIKPSVILVSYPATGDYHVYPVDGNVLYYGDAWRNHSFYTVEGITSRKKLMRKNGILAMQLPDEQEKAAAVLAAVNKVFKHSVILRWSGIYVFASDRKLSSDYDVLDQNAVNSGIYRYMYAPYRIIHLALSTFQDDAENARLIRSAADITPRSLHDLPVLDTKGLPLLACIETIFRNSLKYAPWCLAVIFILYCFSRYWYAGVPGAKLPYQSFETGLISGVAVWIPLLAFSLVNYMPILKIIADFVAVLFILTAMNTLLFVRGKAAASFPVRILMAILCVCAFFIGDLSQTMMCCIALLAGAASVCVGQCAHRCSMPAWFLGAAAACLVSPFIWYANLIYPTAAIFLCYIFFAGYKNTRVSSD